MKFREMVKAEQRNHNNNNNNNRFLYSDFPGLRLVQTALQYTLLQLILFIITDNYRAPPRYMTNTYNGALFKFPNYLWLPHTALYNIDP